MQDSTRKRKQSERDATRHQAVASLATNPAHLIDCREASRSRSLTLFPLASVYDLDSLYPAERERIKKQFAQVVHLRGISGRTFNLMTGQTVAQDTGCPEELAFGCVTHSPADERYSERMLIATRKGKKLVQRPNKQRTIEIESSYQIGEAGALFTERADMMRAEDKNGESQRILIEQASKGHYERREVSKRVGRKLVTVSRLIKMPTPGYQIQGATVEQLERANPTDDALRLARAPEPRYREPLVAPDRTWHGITLHRGRLSPVPQSVIAWAKQFRF